MKPSRPAIAASKIAARTLTLPLIVLGLCDNSRAADFYWDANGVTAGTGGGGSWNTAGTWRDGSATGTLGNWVNGSSAIFGGTAGTVSGVAATAISVNQIKLTSAATFTGTNNLSFVGTYSDSVLAFDALGVTTSINLSQKITGTINGGLVLNGSATSTSVVAGDRLYLSNANNDFVGDVTVLGGKLHTTSFLGNVNNKVILIGGAYFNNGGTGSSRNIQVDAASVISSTISVAPTLSGAISGTGNLTYLTSGAVTLTLSGSMSGYSGTFENASTGGNINLGTTASGGKWKFSSNTTTTLTATNGDAIAHGTGAGAGNLLMNGGTLNMNGKSETINGLSGATGTVRNSLSATASTLTVGDGDATATYDGVLINGGTGTLAFTKIGNGTQTLGGNSTYTGGTTISAGTLLITGSLGNTAVTVGAAGTLGGDGTIGGGALHFEDGARFVFSTTETLTVNGTGGAGVTFVGFGVDDLIGLNSSVANGIYSLIDGTATVHTANLANFGIANAFDLGGGKSAYFELGSLNVVVIPEPKAALLGGIGVLALLRRRRPR
ncbi:autotransporter-associated beta strand repeat-containing protein [Luteolibacter arcticus]|uniref:Autotransporter-associated beta strand repeat-containing protein n=1 Tax=Luteolibacter arcticus TaxID=1581411 RepID=A0ABT3GK28_9BACT|nr:autotransporter-associated beta strand repeat-containing protein [Luteolibacter arcticus]MCW1923874.1 autotransporter-associated beta strand repeat-containing protein [Luteolibacter arcticus]